MRGRRGASSLVAVAFCSALAVAALLAACGGTGSGATVPSRPHVGELAAVVPDGAVTVVVFRPADLWAAPAVRVLAEALFPEAVRQAFAQRTGVDPVRVREAIVAEYDGGVLWLARGPFDAELVVREAGARMGTLESQSDRPFVRRAGFVGNERQEVAALDRDVVAVTGLPDVMAGVLARVAHGRRAGPSALRAAAVSELVRSHRDAPLTVYAPERIVVPEGLGAALLLAHERALAASLRPHGAERLDLDVDLVGEFPPDAAQNFRTWVESVADSDLGNALGLAAGVPQLRVTASASAVRLQMPLQSSNVLTGLRVLFTAELRELLGPGH